MSYVNNDPLIFE